MPGALLLPLLVIHIGSGSIALLSGLAAMASRKSGSGPHRWAGHTFYLSMSVMTASAAVMTAWEPDRLSLGAAIWTFYLVHSARGAARDRTAYRGPGSRWLIPVGITASVLFLHGGLVAQASPAGEYQGTSPAAYFVFGAVAVLASLSDLSLLVRSQLAPRQRIARHLWRMVVAYFLAVTSLFLGQQDDVFPGMAGSPLLLLPSLFTLCFLAFWTLRVRLARNWLAPLSLRRPSSESTRSEEEPA